MFFSLEETIARLFFIDVQGGIVSIIIGQWSKNWHWPSFSVNKVLLNHNHAHSFRYCLWLLCTANTNNCDKPYTPQSLKYLWPGPFQKKFTDVAQSLITEGSLSFLSIGISTSIFNLYSGRTVTYYTSESMVLHVVLELLFKHPWRLCDFVDLSTFILSVWLKLSHIFALVPSLIHFRVRLRQLTPSA